MISAFICALITASFIFPGISKASHLIQTLLTHLPVRVSAGCRSHPAGGPGCVWTGWCYFWRHLLWHLRTLTYTTKSVCVNLTVSWTAWERLQRLQKWERRNYRLSEMRNYLIFTMFLMSFSSLMILVSYPAVYSSHLRCSENYCTRFKLNLKSLRLILAVRLVESSEDSTMPLQLSFWHVLDSNQIASFRKFIWFVFSDIKTMQISIKEQATYLHIVNLHWIQLINTKRTAWWLIYW